MQTYTVDTGTRVWTGVTQGAVDALAETARVYAEAGMDSPWEVTPE